MGDAVKRLIVYVAIALVLVTCAAITIAFSTMPHGELVAQFWPVYAMGAGVLMLALYALRRK